MLLLLFTIVKKNLRCNLRVFDALQYLCASSAGLAAIVFSGKTRTDGHKTDVTWHSCVTQLTLRVIFIFL